MHYGNAFFFRHFNYSIVCLNGFHMRNIFKLSGSWLFHQKPTRFSPNWPTRPIRCSSLSCGGGGLSCPLPMSFFHSLSLALRSHDHLKAPSTVNWARHLLLLLDGHIKRLQAQWSGHIIFFTWSTVKWAHHLFLLLDGHIWMLHHTDSTSPGD